MVLFSSEPLQCPSLDMALGLWTEMQDRPVSTQVALRFLCSVVLWGYLETLGSVGRSPLLDLLQARQGFWN